MQALPGQPGALVSVLARFPQGLARTAADALVIRLTTPGELQRLLPGWAAQLAYTTFPILVRCSVARRHAPAAWRPAAAHVHAWSCAHSPPLPPLAPALQASAAGGSVSPALGQQASLQFTVRLPGTSLAAFNWRLVPWINALKAAAPGGGGGEGAGAVPPASWRASPCTPATAQRCAPAPTAGCRPGRPGHRPSHD